jgi:hypothetical protein
MISAAHAGFGKHKDCGRNPAATAWYWPIRPFAGSLDYEATAKDLQQIVKTKKTELLFLALFLRLLKIGGRAAVRSYCEFIQPALKSL